VVTAEPVAFEIRSRTIAEDQLFREVKALRDEAWVSERRGAYLRDLLSLVARRLPTDATNPYLPFLMHNGMQTARAIGLHADRATAERIAAIREKLALASPSSSGAAYLVSPLVIEAPDRPQAALVGLGDVLVGRVARDLRRRHGPRK
jgi:hypothetical protein